MSERILIIDDEESILDILTQLLGPLGYECVTEKSPVKALDILQESDFALILTDVKMPEMSGLEVVRRAKEVRPETSIVVVTALMDVSNAIEAIRAGADDYVLKPFNLRDITQAVRTALEKRNARLERIEYQNELESRVHEATADLGKIHRELQETKQYLENLLHSTVDAIITANMDGSIEFLNEGALRMLGYDSGELLTQPMQDVLVGGEEEFAFIKKSLRETQRMRNYETELKLKNGATVPVSVSLSLVPNSAGEIVSILAICKDIADQRRLQHELREMSVRDSLTGLYNQRYFHDALEKELERARRQHRPLALILFDVDQFKQYNDTRGHLEGDNVLKAIGRIVGESTREHVDLGCRYGGDEFCVILPEATLDQAVHVAERIRSTFAERSFDNVTLSLGATEYREGQSASDFVQNADQLMYEAKRAGGNRVFQGMPESTTSSEEQPA